MWSVDPIVVGVTIVLPGVDGVAAPIPSPSDGVSGVEEGVIGVPGVDILACRTTKHDKEGVLAGKRGLVHCNVYCTLLSRQNPVSTWVVLCCVCTVWH